VGGRVGVGEGPGDIAFDGSYLWVANYSSDTVSKIDPVGNTVVQTVNVPNGPFSVAYPG